MKYRSPFATLVYPGGKIAVTTVVFLLGLITLAKIAIPTISDSANAKSVLPVALIFSTLAFVVGLAQMVLPCGTNASVGVLYHFHQTPPRRREVAGRIAALTLFMLATSFFSGFVLGLVGRRVVPLNYPQQRVTIASLSVVLGCIALLPIRRRIPQFDRETPPPWTQPSGWRWSMLDGAYLGCGWMTRIQYVVWFAIPAASFVFSSPMTGGVIFGSYGFGRICGTWSLPLMQASDDELEADVFQTRILSMIRQVNLACALLFIGVGSSILVMP